MSRKLVLLLTIVLSMLLAGNALAVNYNINTTVTLSGGAGLAGVLVSVTGGYTGTTGSDGKCTINRSSTSSITVTPTKTNYTFSPVNRTYNLSQDRNPAFTATLLPTISGSVGATAGAGVTMIGFPGTVTSTTGGAYTGTVGSGWNGTITPSKGGYTFNPGNRTYSNVTVDMTTGQDYTSTQVTSQTISGSVGLDGVTMVGLPGSPVSSGGGLYVGSVNGGWSGTVTPTKTGYTFSPVSSTYDSVTSDLTGQNYTPTINTYTISGTVMTIDGVAMNGLPGNPVTSGGGLYSVTVEYGWSGVVSPSKAGGYVFSPANKTYTVVAANMTQNYTTKDKAFTNGSGIDNSLAQANNWNPAGVPVSHSRLFIFGDAAGAAGPLVNTNVNIGTAGTETGDCVFVGNGGEQTALMTVDTGASVIAGPVWVGKLSSGTVNFNGGTWNTTTDYRNWTIGDTAPGVLNMNGGTLTTGVFIIGSSGQVNVAGGKIQPYNGITIKENARVNIKTGTLEQYSNASLTIKAGAVIDINEGRLILLGNQTIKVADVNGIGEYVTEGKIIGSGGKTVLCDYNVTTANKTTVWAVDVVTPTEASNPNPLSGMKYESLSRQLSWTAGDAAVSHDVYLGTNFDDVNNTDDSSALCVSPAQAGTTFDPELENGVTYYWRVDENFDNGTTGTIKGQVWNFETISQEEIPTDANLVGWYDFDDETGIMAWDYTGRGNHATMKNTTFVEGKFGKAMNFVRANQAYVNVPSAVFSTLHNQVTISLWQFGGDALPANTSIFEGTNGTLRNLNSHLPWSSTNPAIYFHAGCDTTTDYIFKASVANDFKGQWNHWAFTKNNATGEMKMYFNGKLWHSGIGLSKSMSGITKFKIGSKADGTGNFYDGLVDDFRIYNRTLNAFEVAVVAGTGPNHNSGDFDGDGKVRFDDVISMAALLNNHGQKINNQQTIPGDSQYYNVMADINGDGMIRFNDLVTVVGWINQHGTMVARKLTIMCPHSYGL